MFPKPPFESVRPFHVKRRLGTVPSETASSVPCWSVRAAAAGRLNGRRLTENTYLCGNDDRRHGRACHHEPQVGHDGNPPGDVVGHPHAARFLVHSKQPITDVEATLVVGESIL